MTERLWTTLVRHEKQAQRAECDGGLHTRLIGQEDAEGVAAWVQAAHIDGVGEHFHRRSAELMYVLEGEGQVLLDGQAHAVRAGSVVHIPPGVIHGARGKLRVLIVGVPDSADDDTFLLDDAT